MNSRTALSLSSALALCLLAPGYIRSTPKPTHNSSSRPLARGTFVLKRIPSSAVHHAQSGGPNIRIAESTSANWSGYAVPAQGQSTFTKVQGSWTLPSVTGTKGSHTYSSIWVGLDGYSNGTVEQIGTEQDWTGKTASYYAWFEMYPDYAFEIGGFPVSPGDQITASVSLSKTDSAGNSIFALTIENQTTGQSASIPTSYTTSSAALLQSAEWIVEAPSSLRGVLPLANFGTARLSGCSANQHDIGYYQNSGLDPLTMASGTGRKAITKAVPSGLIGNAFTVTWHHQ